MNESPLLIYLHGLNSSAQSLKAQYIKQYIASDYPDIDCWIPTLPNEPNQVRHCLLQKVSPLVDKRPIFLIGSSLGGFFGTWLQAHLQNICKVFIPRLVLVNPAADPFKIINKYLGLQKNIYTGEIWELTKAHVNQLKTMTVKTLIDQQQRLLLVQTGDKTLDYRQAVKKYKGSPAIIQEGGSHGFDRFDTVLADIFSFLLMKSEREKSG